MSSRDSQPARSASSSETLSAERREPEKRRSIARTALLVLPAQIGFRALEAALPLLYAYWFGRRDATDVYLTSWAVFAFAGSLVFSMHQDSSLVPILAEERLHRPLGLARLRGSLLAHTWAIGSVISLFVGAFALGFFRLRYSDASFAIAARMVPPFCAVLVAMSTRTFFGTLCTVERQFFIQPIASFVGMIANVGILAATHRSVGITFVPIASLAGEVIAASVLAGFAIRSLRLRIELCFDRSPALLAVARLASSEVGGGAVTRVNPVVDQFMASLCAVVGGVTLLKLSNDVATLPTSLVQAALLPVLISHLAEDFARRDLAGIRRTVVRALLSVCGLLLVASVLLFVVRGPLLRLIYLHGEMDADGVARMVRIFPYHLVGLAPFGALLVLARAHVATKNGAIMFSMGVINATANVLGNVVLIRFLGLEGIALSTSLVQVVIAVVFWFRFESRLAVVRTETLPTVETQAA